MNGDELRAHVAWLLWCMDQGYINKEDRDVGDGNWLLTPDSELHPDDRAAKPHLLAMADEILREVRREVAGL